MSHPPSTRPPERSEDGEARRAEEALRLSEERFRSVFQNAAIGKAIASPELRFLRVNRAYCEMFGYEESELLRMTPGDLTHPEDLEENAELLRALLAGECSSGRVRKRYLDRQGRTIWGDLTLTLIRDGRGQPEYFIAEVVDVTEQERAEERVRDREAKLAEAQRVAHLGSWEYDIATARSIWSDEMYRIFALDPERFDPSRDSAISRIHPEDAERSGALVGETIEKGTPYEYEFRIVLDDGEVRTLWTIGRAELDPEGRPSRVYGIVQDITERKRAEEALRASELRFRHLYTQAPVMMTVVGPDRRFREVSNFWLTRMGYLREEVIGREASEFLSSDSHARLLQEYERSAKSGELVVRSTPVEGLRKDGTSVSLLVTSLLEKDDKGAPLGVVTVGMDVTHMRQAEEAVRMSEARYRALVEHAPEAIVVLDVESQKFIDLNANVETLFGFTRARLLDMGPLDFAPETQPDGTASRDVVHHQVGRVRHGETPVFEFVHTHLTGREIPCQIRLARLPASGRELIRATIADISELKALQERVRHEDKMAAIGVLAAGVAHEVGNPLLALSMAVQSLERKATDEYSLKKLGLVREHVERITKIVRQMSDLARPRQARRTACDLNRVIERSLEIIHYDKRTDGVEIRFEPCPELPLVQASEDQLMQVCLNLGLNALDVMISNPPSRPASLVVRTGLVERGGRRLVRASFLDSGPGIPEASRALVFQPFFTTKQPGKGTGLGLSVSYRILAEHEGTLAFECDESRGTEFFFELPTRQAP